MSHKIAREQLEKWADYLIDYSIGGVTENDVVMVKGEHIAWPLISVIQDKIFAKGAIADVNMVAPDNDRGKVWGASMARHGSVEQTKKVPQWQAQRYRSMTKYIEVLGAEDPAQFGNTNEDIAMAVMRADEPVKNLRMQVPWVITLYPTQGFADMEGMSLERYSEIIVNASMVDPRLLDEIEDDIYQLMNKSNVMRVITEHPATQKELELKLDISGRNVIKCTGKRNFPDGEVFTSPNYKNVNGDIFVDLPVSYDGATIRGIYLKFMNGQIVEYTAEEGFENLKKIIETDEGSHRLGEVALGMNNGIEAVLKHPLFVEKVGGTLHIAIGASYPECYVTNPASEEGAKKADALFKQGKLNRSAQHVDIVADFRKGGQGRAVYLDDVKLEIENNIWVVPENHKISGENSGGTSW
jgi:aminopeptidase